MYLCRIITVIKTLLIVIDNITTVCVPPNMSLWYVTEYVIMICHQTCHYDMSPNMSL